MTRRDILVRFGKVFARGFLFFMVVAVVLKLFLGEPWKIMSMSLALFWAIGELVSYIFKKHDTCKALLLKVVTAAIVFVTIAFMTGVLKGSPDWSVWSCRMTGTYAFVTLISPLWQK